MQTVHADCAQMSGLTSAKQHGTCGCLTLWFHAKQHSHLHLGRTHAGLEHMYEDYTLCSSSHVQPAHISNHHREHQSAISNTYECRPACHACIVLQEYSS